MHTHMHTHIYTCTHTHTYTHTYIYIYLYIHTHTHTHIYTLICIHTYIYIQCQKQSVSLRNLLLKTASIALKIEFGYQISHSSSYLSSTNLSYLSPSFQIINTIYLEYYIIILATSCDQIATKFTI